MSSHKFGVVVLGPDDADETRFRRFYKAAEEEFQPLTVFRKGKSYGILGPVFVIYFADQKQMTEAEIWDDVIKSLHAMNTLTSQLPLKGGPYKTDPTRLVVVHSQPLTLGLPPAIKTVGVVDFDEIKQAVAASYATTTVYWDEVYKLQSVYDSCITLHANPIPARWDDAARDELRSYRCIKLPDSGATIDEVFFGDRPPSLHVLIKSIDRPESRVETLSTNCMEFSVGADAEDMSPAELVGFFCESVGIGFVEPIAFHKAEANPYFPHTSDGRSVTLTQNIEDVSRIQLDALPNTKIVAFRQTRETSRLCWALQASEIQPVEHRTFGSGSAIEFYESGILDDRSRRSFVWRWRLLTPTSMGQLTQGHFDSMQAKIKASHASDVLPVFAARKFETTPHLRGEIENSERLILCSGYDTVTDGYDEND